MDAAKSFMRFLVLALYSYNQKNKKIFKNLKPISQSNRL